MEEEILRKRRGELALKNTEELNTDLCKITSWIVRDLREQI
jgi:hypothetical protein